LHVVRKVVNLQVGVGQLLLQGTVLRLEFLNAAGGPRDHVCLRLGLVQRHLLHRRLQQDDLVLLAGNGRHQRAKRVLHFGRVGDTELDLGPTLVLKRHAVAPEGPHLAIQPGLECHDDAADADGDARGQLAGGGRAPRLIGVDWRLWPSTYDNHAPNHKRQIHRPSVCECDDHDGTTVSFWRVG
jgi:hypothetical protein